MEGRSDDIQKRGTVGAIIILKPSYIISSRMIMNV